MSATYRITLIQLKPDAAGIGASGDKVDHGTHPVEEVIRLSTKLLTLDHSDPKLDPGIIVQRGDKGWRIAVNQGRLRLHKSMSLFDDFWTVETPAGLLDLPPFRTAATEPAPARAPRASGKRQPGTVRSLLEAAGLFAAALLLVAVGLRFGLPQRRVSDLPPGLLIVSAAEERATIFRSVAGYYSTDRKPGSDLVIISPDGRVALATIGPDGKPTAPRLQEQARAGRQDGIACVVTSFGIISGIAPPDEIRFGRFSWKKAPESVTALN